MDGVITNIDGVITAIVLLSFGIAVLRASFIDRISGIVVFSIVIALIPMILVHQSIEEGSQFIENVVKSRIFLNLITVFVGEIALFVWWSIKKLNEHYGLVGTSNEYVKMNNKLVKTSSRLVKLISYIPSVLFVCVVYYTEILLLITIPQVGLTISLDFISVAVILSSGLLVFLTLGGIGLRKIEVESRLKLLFLLNLVQFILIILIQSS